MATSRACGRWTGIAALWGMLCGGCDDGSATASENPKPTPAVDILAAEPSPEPVAGPARENIAGAVFHDALYVQDCGDTFPCPDLPQPAGEEHCKALDMGGTGWRLPTKAEVEVMGGVEGLQMTAAYHFTSTPFDQDERQVWIVDPTGDARATTIPRDRKPFRIRCVREPEG